MKYLFILALFLFASLASAFDLNPLFTDRMVLQRELPIRIYGRAEVDADGKWLVILDPQPASFTGRELLVRSSNNFTEKKIIDVLIGDVWVCAGQSNMGSALRRTLPVPETFPRAEGLRLLKSVTPNSTSTSAVSFYFGKSVMENYKQKHPFFLYNGLMHTLIQFPIKGMIWYQGESNASKAAIQGWRAACGQGDFPFFFVQLPGFHGKIEWAWNRSIFWTWMREAQESTRL